LPDTIEQNSKQAPSLRRVVFELPDMSKVGEPASIDSRRRMV
jgi:hypothetical protein